METQFHNEASGSGPDGPDRPQISTKNWARNQLILCLFILTWLIFLHFRLSLHKTPAVQILGQAFDLTRESSVPTYWSCLLALGVGITCFFVSLFLHRDGASALRRHAWTFAGIVFLALSVDDAVAFHERVGAITSIELLESLNFTSYPWHVTVAPFLATGLLTACFFIWRDIRKLPGLTAMLFFALACYGAAFGLDFQEGVTQMASIASQQPAPGSDSLPMMMVAEETLEIVGTTFFLYVVFSYLVHLIGDLDCRRRKATPQIDSTEPASQAG